MKNNRKTYLDIARIVAIFFVLYNHTGGLQLYKIHTGPSQFIDFIFATFTVINVPLFFMVSGSLLLDKEETFLEIFKHRIMRFIMVIVIFTFAMFFLVKIKSMYVEETEIIALKDIVFDIFSGEVTYLHVFWFMYAYIGFLVMLPFLRLIAKGLDKEKFCILIGVAFIYHTFIPVIDIILRSRNMHGLNLSSYFNESISIVVFRSLLYPLLGYYIDKKIDVATIRLKHIVLLFVATMIGVVATTMSSILQSIICGGYTVDYLNVSTYVTTIFVFVLIKWLFGYKRPIKNSRIINFVSCAGSLTFGIYILDPFMRLLFMDKYIDIARSVYANISYHQIASVIWTIGSMIVSGIIIYVIKKLPLFKTIL